ncbi:MAG: class I SAM-dependent methyltransferase [Proteobacteria bacterium]|nr:class I SAM-dependent methyltransferase [Verrucomicrobiota bacterium]NBU09730.1 class I SAM-dependent methyltransferase [Pseudomonadota bacterium]
MSATFTCRSCGSTRGELVLDLGHQPLANNLLRPADLGQPEPRFPLRVFVCPDCWLLQITDLVPPVTLFSEYLYFSSFSETMLRHAREAAERYRCEFALGPHSRVVEIASNDGYLLQNFQRAGVPCLGIEPAANIAKVAREKGIETWTEFFGLALAQRLVAERGPVDLVLGNNVFAHAPDTNDFVAGLKALLQPGGRVVLEFPQGLELLEHAEFDTIYHEHVFYFTLTALRPLFARHGLEIFHVERLAIHGGSLRIFASHVGAHPVMDSVGAQLATERAGGVDSLARYTRFAAQAAGIRTTLCEQLATLRAQGKRIAAYGASAKGSTLLNYCGLGRETLEFVADRSTYKQGRLTPGTHLPIVAAEELAARQPDYTLLLTWNFAEEILRQQQAYRDAGGRFIVPVPEVRIV